MPSATKSYADEIKDAWAEILEILGLKDQIKGPHIPEHVVMLAICRKLQMLETAVARHDPMWTGIHPQ